jgi:uncharacterized protein with HEPN domain
LRREPSKLLWDARDAADAILEFTRGKSVAEYSADPVLSSAVERKFEIIGEALSQLARIAPAMAGEIPELPRIVAFRNILVHGYAVVDPARVWRIVIEELPALRDRLRILLGEA